MERFVIDWKSAEELYQYGVDIVSEDEQYAQIEALYA